jgi:hypothetical protein
MRPARPACRLPRLLGAVVVASALGVGGCATLGFGAPGTEPSAWTRRLKQTWQGPACGEVIHPLAPTDPKTRLATTPSKDLRLQVLLAVCPRLQPAHKGPLDSPPVPQQDRVTPLDPFAWHLEFDDEDPSPLVAGLVAFWLTHPPPSRGEPDLHSVRAKNAGLGLGLFYARLALRADLKSALAATELPDDAQAAFVANVKDAAARLLAAVEGRPSPRAPRGPHTPVSKPLHLDERALFVALPEEVFALRAASFEHHHARYEQLAALERAPDRHALLALHQDYLSACGELSCLDSPLVARVHRAVLPLLINAGDRVAGELLLEVHRERDAIPITFAEAVSARQQQLGAQLYRRWEQNERARGSGLSPAQAFLAHGGPGFPFDSQHTAGDDRHWLRAEARRYPPDVVFGNRRPPVRRTHVVQAVQLPKAAGDPALVLFADEDRTSGPRKDCRPTDQVEQIRPDGRVVFKLECKERHLERVVTPPPVLLPVGEARHLSPGDTVLLLAPSSDGPFNLATAHRGKELLQVGAVRFP